MNKIILLLLITISAFSCGDKQSQFLVGEKKYLDYKYDYIISSDGNSILVFFRNTKPIITDSLVSNFAQEVIPKFFKENIPLYSSPTPCRVTALKDCIEFELENSIIQVDADRIDNTDSLAGVHLFKFEK